MPHADVRAVIEAHNKTVESLYASGKVDELGQHFSRDVWQMPPNSAPLAGRDALVGFWSEAVAWGRWSFELDTQDVIASPPLAVERGKYRLSFEAGPNAPPEMSSFEDYGNYVVVWQQEDDNWRILWDAPVSEVPLKTG